MRATEVLERIFRKTEQDELALQKSHSLKLLDLFSQQIQEELEGGFPVNLFDFFWFSKFSPNRLLYLSLRYNLREGEKNLPDFSELPFWKIILREFGDSLSDLETDEQFRKNLTLLAYEWKDRYVTAERRSG